MRHEKEKREARQVTCINCGKPGGTLIKSKKGYIHPDCSRVPETKEEVNGKSK